MAAERSPGLVCMPILPNCRFQLNSIMFTKELFAYRHVLYQLVTQQLLARYRRTIFGYLWTILNPLMMMTVSAVVFSHIFRLGLRDYAIFLFAATVPWNFFSGCVVQAGSSIVSNEGLIKKVYVPKLIFPISTAIGCLLDSLFGLVALFVIAFVVGARISPALFFLPISFAILYFFALGLALMLSVAMVYFRDLQHLIGVLMQALYFLTPIMYQPSAISPSLQNILRFNPLLYFVDLFRAPIYRSELPSLTVIGIALVAAIASFSIGLKLFRSYENKLIFRL
ncbi:MULTISPECIES: ABC transporter permease [Burkholderia]|nr:MULTISPECIES: ABC transporter permease [Burkholderia]MCA8296526.1 ABC transporter permease [Burkholderia sp. AU30198]UKD12300.1 ABC transporter permease [Burkholderia aenigmatica]